MKKYFVLNFLVAMAVNAAEYNYLEDQQQPSTVEPYNLVYAPWRDEYADKTQKVTNLPDQSHCVFCPHLALSGQELAALSDDDPNKYFVIQRFDCGTCLVTNANPYGNGHVMLISFNHYTDMIQLKGKEVYEWAEVMRWTGPIVQRVYGAQGYNIGLNSSRFAGKSVDHLHMHGLPRFTEGFYSVIGNNHIVTESPKKTWGRLQPIFKKLYDVMRDGETEDLTLEKLLAEENK